MLPLLLCLIVSADELAFDPGAKPVPEVVDLCDADGDGMILDAEFAAAVKRLVAIGKSKKKLDQAAAKRLDLDGDEKLSEQEAVILCATARHSEDAQGKKILEIIHARFDQDGDWLVTRKEIASFGDLQLAAFLRSIDTDGDGAVSALEIVGNLDRYSGRTNVQSRRDPQLWQRALKLTKGKQLSKLDAPKEVREKFDEIDADKSGAIRTIELFNWMLAN
jgi:Ca2+-binding EF-hand superfamily protein